jgi:hypothetical protein
VLDRIVRYLGPGKVGARKAFEENGLPPALAGMFPSLGVVVLNSGLAAGTTDDISKVLAGAPTMFAHFVRNPVASWAKPTAYT